MKEDDCFRRYNHAKSKSTVTPFISIDVLGSCHKHLAEGMAALLPPAPRYPL